MKKFSRWLVVFSTLALIAAGCGADGGDGDGTGGSTDPDEPSITEVGEGEGEVSIISWAGYIERGETDPAYDWVTQFESDTGCTVTNKTANTSDEMVALMQEGGGQYDLVTASGDASLRLIESGTVQPVNLDLIESYDTVDPNLKDAPWFTVDTDGDGTTEHYGVPYQWGYNVLMYNDAIFKGEAPTSWSVVFEETTLPDGKSNKGRVQAYDGAIYIADAAVYLRAHNPELGIDGSVRADPRTVRCGAEPAAAAAGVGRSVLARRVRPDRRLRQRGSGRQLVLAVPEERLGGREPRLQELDPGGGRHRVGGHHDDAHGRPAPELRIHVDGLVA